MNALDDKRSSFSVIILDWLMPGMDGEGVLTVLREFQIEHPPIIVISALSASEVKQ